MSEFLWTSGHLGWGIFALAVFSALWWLLADLCWRLTATRFARLAALLGAGWVVGVGLIVLGWWLAA